MTIQFIQTKAQEKAKQFFEVSFERNQIHHAYLIHGSFGLGQELFALDLAHILACTSQEKPCGVCHSCKMHRITGGIWILPLNKSSDKKEKEERAEAVQNLRQELLKSPYTYSNGAHAEIFNAQILDLREALRYPPTQGEIRVIYLFYPELLRMEAANALLKTLEEPPPSTFFILVSQNKMEVLPTILSRCVQVALVPYTAPEMKEALGNITSDPLLKLCQGSPGLYLWLLQIHEQIEPHLVEEFFGLLKNPNLLEFSAWVQSHSGKDQVEDFWRPFLKYALYTLQSELRQEIEKNNITSAQLNHFRQIKDLLESSLKGIGEYAQIQILLPGLLAKNLVT